MPFLDFWMKCEECTGGQCGGAVFQSSQCQKYIACYGATGGNSSALVATADACTRSCTWALSSLRTSYPGVFACQ